MSERPPTPPEGAPSERRGKPADAVLAAELALGVLDPASQTRAQARAASDDAFAADAADWTRRLHPLLEEVAPVEPSAALWVRIAGAAGLEAEGDAVGPAAPSLAPTAAADKAPPTAQVIPFRRSRSLAAWRAAAVAGFALAAASLAVVVMLEMRPLAATSPLLAAKLAPVSPGPSILNSEPLFVATLDRSRGAVVMTPLSPGPVDPRARELWLIPKGGKPIAAGLLDLARIKPVPLKPELLKLAEAGATLAVSLEPAGGSPTGAPTGPVIAAGVLANI